MGFLGKLKLLFAERKPIEDVIAELKQIKTGFKTWQWWVGFLTSVAALIAGASVILPPNVALIATTAITLIVSLYNVWRGAVKSQVQGQPPFFFTSEWWLSITGAVSAAIVNLQHGGINPQAFGQILAAIGVIGASLGAGQNLAGQSPTPAAAVAQSPAKG